MAISNQVLFLFVLLLPIISPISGDDDLITKECGKIFTNNEILRGNINKTILDLVAKTSANGFANSSHGVGDNAIYGIAECRGDISNQECSECITSAARQIQTTCPNAAESRIWYQYCFLRYNTSNFFGQVDMSPVDVRHSADNVTNPLMFKQTLNELSVVLWLAAAYGDGRKLGWGKISNHNLKINGEIVIIYGMTQCTWDLDGSTCVSCLANAVNIRDSECGGRTSCYVITKSCALRNEINPFLHFNAQQNLTEVTSSISFDNI